MGENRTTFSGRLWKENSVAHTARMQKATANISPEGSGYGKQRYAVYNDIT